MEVYGDHALAESTCRNWFSKFKSGDFDVVDKERSGRPEKFEDLELQALLDEDPCQTQNRLAETLGVSQKTISNRLKAMGKIRKCGKWVPHELNDRQMENRKLTCESLLRRHERKSFLHRIVTGDVKWIYFDNPKLEYGYYDPGTPAKSTAKPNRFGKKLMMCIWWDQRGIVYYELLKPGETVNGQRYRQQMINLNHALIEKRPEWATRHGKVILLHDNAPSHTTNLVKETINALKWDVNPHPPYSPDLAPSDYYLFSAMSIALAGHHFNEFEEVENWLIRWFASKNEKFYWDGIHELPERWEKCAASDGKYFE